MLLPTLGEFRGHDIQLHGKWLMVERLVYYPYQFQGGQVFLPASNIRVGNGNAGAYPAGLWD